MKKKGYFFTIDAFFAVLVLVIGLIIVWNSYSSRPLTTPSEIVSQDLTTIFSTTKIIDLSDIYYPYIRDLKLQGKIVNYDNTLLEQIAFFYSEDEIEVATNFTKELAEELVPEHQGFEIIVENTSIFKRDFVKEVSSLVGSKKIVYGFNNQTYELWGPLLVEVRVWQ